MNVDIRNLEDYIFDCIYDWYALADEFGNEDASIMLNGFDALCCIDDGKILKFLLSTTYSTMKLCIVHGQNDHKKMWAQLQDRLNDAVDTFIDNGWINPGSVYFEIDPYDTSRAVIYYEE